ncbi:MAG: sigma-70 family RNA polymerase sigma factor [Bacteroidota bacterium]
MGSRLTTFFEKPTDLTLRNIHAKISDEEIVALLKNKDRQGISMLYTNYSRLLFGVILRIVKQQDLSENVLQDVFLKVWQNIHQYHPSKGRFPAWVMNIARNSAIDLVRSKGYRKNNSTAAVEPAMEQQFSSEINVDHIGLRDLVQKLDPKHRRLIELLYFEGYTQAEVSEELAVPLGTVKSRVRKAFSDLRILLK